MQFLATTPVYLSVTHNTYQNDSIVCYGAPRKIEILEQNWLQTWEIL